MIKSKLRQVILSTNSCKVSPFSSGGFILDFHSMLCFDDKCPPKSTIEKSGTSWIAVAKIELEFKLKFSKFISGCLECFWSLGNGCLACRGLEFNWQKWELELWYKGTLFLLIGSQLSKLHLPSVYSRAYLQDRTCRPGQERNDWAGFQLTKLHLPSVHSSLMLDAIFCRTGQDRTGQERNATQ